jgi:hypothetical protein
LSTSTIAAQHGPGQRQWRDLSKVRLFLGLAFAPVPPIAIGALILAMLSSGLFLGSPQVSRVLGAILAAAETWSMLGGTAFLVASRFRGVVRRAHCLLLGAFLAFSLPSAAYLASNAVDWVFSATAERETVDDDLDGDFHGPSDATFVFVAGLVLVPFGTLGGWVFWRVGVYPARPKVLDVATVFD